MIDLTSAALADVKVGEIAVIVGTVGLAGHHRAQWRGAI